MPMVRSSRWRSFVDALLYGTGGWFFLLLPALLMFVASLRCWDQKPWILWGGLAFQLVICALSFGSRRSWKQPIGPSIITLYLTALAWLWFGDPVTDWLNHLTKGILIGMPVLVFCYQTLIESRAPEIRRANLLAHRLAERQDWPAELAQCRILPEVKAFRAALTCDAAPALALLQHARLEVRVAALAALEFRKDWRPGQAEHVLQFGQRAEQPAARAAAVLALANLEDRQMLETLAQFFHDPSPEVRRAAIDALLWDCERRWSWIRYAVRRTLSDPMFKDDGPIVPEGQTLTHEVVQDMTAWCAEKGLISARAAETLATHYHRLLSEQSNPKILETIRRQVADPQTPALLRLELGKLMQIHQELDAQILEQLLDPKTPTTLRLIASETILSLEIDHLLHDLAVSTLKDLSRLPNREIALGAADVVQRRLGVDLGIGLGQPLPAVATRQATEIIRRLSAWASQGEEELERSGAPRKSRWAI